MGQDTSVYHENDNDITSQVALSDWARANRSQGSEADRKKREDRKNSNAIDSLSNDGVQHSVDLDQVQDGNSFKNMAAGALDALVPGEGSQVSLIISGTIPLYKNIGVSVDFKPSLTLKAQRLNNKLRASISATIAFKASVGTEGSWYWPQFIAYFKASFNGSLLIIGDDANEIFDEFMLALSHVAEAACEASNAPDNITDRLVDGIMDASARERTLKGMDKTDSVTLALGVSAEAGVDTSFGDANAGISYTKLQTLKRNEETGKLEAKTVNDIAGHVGFTFKADKLGASVPAKAGLTYRNGALRSLSFSAGINKTLDWGTFGPEVMIGTEWLLDVVNGISNGIDYVNKGIGSRDLSMLVDTVSNLSVMDEAITYTVFGDQLKNAALQTGGGKALDLAKKVSFGVDVTVGWSSFLGHHVSVILSSTDSVSLGTDALSVEIKKADQILKFVQSSKKGGYLGS